MNIFLLCVFVAYVQTYLEDRYSNLEEKKFTKTFFNFPYKMVFDMFQINSSIIIEKIIFDL